MQNAFLACCHARDNAQLGYACRYPQPRRMPERSRTCLGEVRDDMAKATAARRERTTKADPKAKTEGAHQEGRFSIQTGQTDRKSKARQKAGQIAFQKQDLPGERHPGKVASAPKAAEGSGRKSRRRGKHSRDLGDVRGTRQPEKGPGKGRMTPSRKAVKRLQNR